MDSKAALDTTNMNHVKIYTRRADLPKGTKVIDTVTGSLRELLIIRNPKLKSSSDEVVASKLRQFGAEVWGAKPLFVYYPWKKVAVRILNEEIYFELRTARNRNIITAEEQRKYRDIRVGVVGLSIGSNVLNALVFSGGPKFLKIADFDTIEITNLNRLRAPLYSVGENKAEVAARQVWELDPFADIDIWDKGVSRETIEKFITENPTLDVFIDEMDDLSLKIISRIICRQHKIPVIMVTDNGDNVILDVERFDLESKRPILHGLVKEIDPETLSNLPYSEWVKIATKIVDPKNLTKRMRESVQEIGKSIAAVPQLGTTATIAGATAAYVVRKIAIGDDIKSGRYFISLDSSVQ